MTLTNHIKGEWWRKLDGYDYPYCISNYGRLIVLGASYTRIRNEKSFDTYIPTHELKSFFNKYKGYYSFRIKLNGKYVNRYVHRLIAEYFIENPNGYKVVNHINGNKSDNRIENLEWCTHSYNNVHAFDHGLKEAKSKLSDSELVEIFRLRDCGLTNKSIANRLKYNNSSVGKIFKGRLMKRRCRKLNLI